MTQERLYGFGFALLALAFAAAGHVLGRVHALPRPLLGPRGLARARWLERGGLAGVEWLLRLLAALCARLRPPSAAPLHLRLERLLERAGLPLGLCADECFALCVAAASVGGAVAHALGCSALHALLFAACAGALPVIKVHEQARLRERAIARRLPAAIDLMALCMGAGLDFVGALRLVTGERAGIDDALHDELQRMQQELALGRTRQKVLGEFGERVPAPAVRDFVHAVIQAEQKGNPLSDVLLVQAQMLRMRRSVSAEEAAARAGVLLALPLMLLICAVLVLMFGPFIVRGVGL